MSSPRARASWQALKVRGLQRHHIGNLKLCIMLFAVRMKEEHSVRVHPHTETSPPFKLALFNAERMIRRALWLLII